MSTEERKTPFLEAIRNHDLEKMRGLIAEGADVNELDRFGLTPLHFAVISGFDEGAKLLLENGAKVDSLSSRKTTPLHHAAKAGHSKCLAALLEHHADVMICDESTTAFGYAVKKGHMDAARALLAAAEQQGGAELKQKMVNLADSKGETPLRLAVAEANMELVLELVRAGACPVEAASDGGALACVLSGLDFAAPAPILPAASGASAATAQQSVFVKQIAALRDATSAAYAAVKPDFSLKVEKSGEGDEMSDDAHSVRVHRAILAARCPHFAALFAEKPEVAEETVPGATAAQLGWLADWLYTDAMPALEGAAFGDTLAVYRAALHLFSESTDADANKDVDAAAGATTPLPALVDKLARGLTPATLREAWPVVWAAEHAGDATVQRLRAHALLHAIKDDATTPDAQAVLAELRTVPAAALADTLAACPLRQPADAQTAADAQPAANTQPAADDGGAAAQGSTGGGDRVVLVYSVQCPQETKDDIAETDRALGRVLAEPLGAGMVALGRKMVTTMLKNPSSPWFRVAVDEARDGAPGYYAIIKHPMDLRTLRSTYLERAADPAPTLGDFLNDGRMMWQNAMTYNRSDSPVFVAALKMGRLWEKLARATAWTRPPAATPPHGLKRPAPASASRAAPSSHAHAHAHTHASSAPMSAEEQRVMSEKIKAMEEAGDNEALIQLLKIANIDPSSGDVELDFTKLSNETLRRMEAFVNSYNPKK